MAVLDRQGEVYFFNDPPRYQNRGLLLFARWQGTAYILVVLNLSGREQWAPFWFPIAGNYQEKLHGSVEPQLNLSGVGALQETWLAIPPNLGGCGAASEAAAAGNRGWDRAGASKRDFLPLPAPGEVTPSAEEMGLPWHNYLHLSQELGLLLGRGELVIRETELLATHHPSPGLRLQDHRPANGAGFPEYPWY